MRIVIAATVMLACLATTAQAADEAPEIKVSKYGKVFTNPDLTVEMAIYDAKNGNGLNNVLLRFIGRPAEEEGIDGKVLQYDATRGGTGVDFRGRNKHGEGINRMSSRQTWGSWSSFEAYFDGKTYHLVLDEKASKALATEALVNDYKASRAAAK